MVIGIMRSRRQNLLDPRSNRARCEGSCKSYLLTLPKGVSGFGAVRLASYRQARQAATEVALQTDKGVVLAGGILEMLRLRRTIIPGIDVIERICAEAIARANRQIYAALTDPLSDEHRQRLDELLNAVTAARRRGSPGCASRRSSRIRGTCASTSSV